MLRQSPTQQQRSSARLRYPVEEESKQRACSANCFEKLLRLHSEKLRRVQLKRSSQKTLCSFQNPIPIHGTEGWHGASCGFGKQNLQPLPLQLSHDSVWPTFSCGTPNWTLSTGRIGRETARGFKSRCRPSKHASPMSV